jgi:hypothetical protein
MTLYFDRTPFTNIMIRSRYIEYSRALYSMVDPEIPQSLLVIRRSVNITRV